MLIVFFLSIYMVIDRDQILAFLFRLVPPAYAEEARLLQTSVSRSFGGFLRGQAILGIMYFLVALRRRASCSGCRWSALTAAAAGILMAIPFFGPFVAWAPPVIVALALQARRAPARDRPDGRGLVRRHEHPPAADHAGRRRDPPDRRPRVGAHRRRDRRHPGRDLRHPDRGGRLGLLLPLPAPDVRRPIRRRTAAKRAERARGPAGPRSRANRSPAAPPTSTTSTGPDAESRAPATGRDRGHAPVSDDRPDMTRERARTERRDLDKERGEPRRRRRGAGRTAGRCARPPGRSREWTSRPRILVTNDDGVESRGLLALKQALDPIGDVTVVAPDTNQSAVGHQKTLMRPLRVRERTLGRRLAGLLGRRLADRRGEPRVPGLLRARLRPGRVGHQLRREPRRRHHLLGHGERGDGGGHQQLPGVRDLAGVLRASRLRAGRPSPPRPSPGTSSSTACRRASWSTSTCRP